MIAHTVAGAADSPGSKLVLSGLKLKAADSDSATCGCNKNLMGLGCTLLLLYMINYQKN